MGHRRWGNAMTTEALEACREDIASANREQLADDVADLLEEVATLRFVIECLHAAAV